MIDEITKDDPRWELKRYLRNLAVATVALFVALTVASGLFFWKISNVADQGQRAHSAVCLLRDDERARVQSSLDYLAAHPDITELLGVPIAQIEASIAQQQRTIAALAVANCGS